MSLSVSELERRCEETLLALAGSKSGGDAAHDLGHVRRVVRNARALAAAEGARLEIVLPAAWLHDCVSVAKDAPDRAEASRRAAEQAVRWLRDWGYAEEWLGEIAHAIEAHSFSAGIAPRTLEAKVVQDADRLEALGAVGVARCFLTGGALGRPLHAAHDPFCATRPPDDRAATLDHFFSKLLTLESTMQTASGRAEARRRTAFLRQFLAEIEREISGDLECMMGDGLG